jgi:hypothetical protein
MRSGSAVYSNADSGSLASREIAARLAAELPYPMCQQPPSGQAAGALLAVATRQYLINALEALAHLRPLKWEVALTQGADRIAAFEQYSHLAELRAMGRANPRIRWLLNVDYLVAPDITVSRAPWTLDELDPQGRLDITNTTVRYSPAVARVGQLPLLHASVSCKWTIRSDRAQNSRTEALNLLRNRKGRSPHIVVVTFEPLPSRLAAIAAGTGDIDCTYHGALHELRAAVGDLGIAEQGEVLEALIEGHRLRDIADLPFDLVA